MEAKIIKESDVLTVIEWRKGNQFGQLIIRYNGKGGFLIDAEYMSMDSVIEILKAI